jgi:hypothetical protein
MTPSTEERTEGKIHEVKGQDQRGNRKGDQRSLRGSRWGMSKRMTAKSKDGSVEKAVGE